MARDLSYLPKDEQMALIPESEYEIRVRLNLKGLPVYEYTILLGYKKSGHE